MSREKESESRFHWHSRNFFFFSLGLEWRWGQANEKWAESSSLSAYMDFISMRISRRENKTAQHEWAVKKRLSHLHAHLTLIIEKVLHILIWRSNFLNQKAQIEIKKSHRLQPFGKASCLFCKTRQKVIPPGRDARDRWNYTHRTHIIPSFPRRHHQMLIFFHFALSCPEPKRLCNVLVSALNS